MKNKSYYSLEIFCPPGGAREAKLYIHTDVEYIKKEFEKSTQDATGVLGYLSANREAILKVYIEGKIIEEHDLTTIFNLQVEGFPLVSIFDVDCNLPAFKAGKAINWDDFADQYTQLEQNGRKDKIDIKFSWHTINIPKLREPLLSPNDKLKVYSEYFQEKEQVKFGLNDLEFG